MPREDAEYVPQWLSNNQRSPLASDLLTSLKVLCKLVSRLTGGGQGESQLRRGRPIGTVPKRRRTNPKQLE